MKKDKKKTKRWISIVGNSLMIISVFFIANYFYKEKINFEFLKERTNVLLSIVLIFLSSISVFFLAVAWKCNIETISNVCTISNKDAIWLCSRANLARYIPGNVAHYASRNVIGAKYNLKQYVMAIASLMEVLLVVLVGGMIAIFFMYDNLKLVVSNVGEDIKFWLGMGIVLLIIIATSCILFFLKKKKCMITMLQITKMFKSIVMYFGFHGVNLLVFGIIIVYIFDYGSWGQILSFGGYYLIAWIIGMLTPGAPGGIGIREYILLLLLKNQMQESVVLQVGVFMRIITICGDIFAAMVGVTLRMRGMQLKESK